MYIYILYRIVLHLKIRFHIARWHAWDSNPQLPAYRAHALTTELSDGTMRCA